MTEVWSHRVSVKRHEMGLARGFSGCRSVQPSLRTRVPSQEMPQWQERTKTNKLCSDHHLGPHTHSHANEYFFFKGEQEIPDSPTPEPLAPL